MNYREGNKIFCRECKKERNKACNRAETEVNKDMKIVGICDAYVRPEHMEELKKVTDNPIEIYDNPELATEEQTAKVMLKTEQQGPESFPADEKLMEAVKDADIIVVHMSPINRAVIDAAKNLKLVAVLRGGCDSVNVAYLNQKGIPVVNAPWRSANAVADFAVGMILCEMKNIARGHHGILTGQWIKNYANSYDIHDLRKQRIGIIGFGYIGQRVAQRLKGFESEIVVYDPFMKKEVIEGMGYQFVSEDELLKTADIVTLHLRLSESTKDYLNREKIAKMKSTAILVNTSRAGLIEENALLDALKTKAIKGAALDVFNQEPLPEDNEYVKLDNVTMTPHIAGVSNDTFSTSIEIVAEELERYFRGEELRCRVKE